MYYFKTGSAHSETHWEFLCHNMGISQLCAQVYFSGFFLSHVDEVVEHDDLKLVWRSTLRLL